MIIAICAAVALVCIIVVILVTIFGNRETIAIPMGIYTLKDSASNLYLDDGRKVLNIVVGSGNAIMLSMEDTFFSEDLRGTPKDGKLRVSAAYTLDFQYDGASIFLNGVEFVIGNATENKPASALSGAVTGDIVQFGGYDWRVLDVQGGRALLLSEKIIEHMPYNADFTSVTWETSDIRTYLNQSFFNSFSKEDKTRILDTNVINNDNLWNNTFGGVDTVDKIFLLSIDEVVQYFSDGSLLSKIEPLSEDDYLTDEALLAYCANQCHGNHDDIAWWWWLRSPGSDSRRAAGVNGFGSLHYDGLYVDETSGGLRPALWLDLTEDPSSGNQTGFATVARPIVFDVIQFGGYDWRVLDFQDGKTLVLSETILFEMNYNEEYAWSSWEASSIRVLLNEDFYNSFSVEDKARIVLTNVVNTGNPWFHSDGGYDTEDYFFLLSIEEVVRYFGDSGQLANGNPDSEEEIYDQNNSRRIAYRRIGLENNVHNSAIWWLRTPGNITEIQNGYLNNNVITVGQDGSIFVWGIDAKNSIPIGVRPALWLDMR